MDAVIIERIAQDTTIPDSSVAAAVALFEKGATGPFIVHYRREATGGLDEAKVRSIQDRMAHYREVLDQRASLLKLLTEQGKLTDELRVKIETCFSKVDLDDLHHQFRPRKKTRSAEAIEKGLAPLAEFFWKQEFNARGVEEHINDFVDPAKGIPTKEHALQGVVDIIAEWIWENSEYRKSLREMLWNEGFVVSSVVPAKVSQKTKYNMYYDRRESVTTIPSHRVLAIRRGSKEGILMSSIEGDHSKAMETLLSSIIKDKESIFTPILEAGVRECYNRILRPLIETEVRTQLKERADREAIRVFQENLANLLLSPPAGPIVVMGVDWGKGDECSVAVVNEAGLFLEGARVRFAPKKSAHLKTHPEVAVEKSGPKPSSPKSSTIEPQNAEGQPTELSTAISASEEVPAQEPIQADAVISVSEEAPAQEPIQADAVISASEEVPAQEPIQADAVISVSEEAPAQEPIQADAVISVSEEAPAQEPIQADAVISASEEVPAQEPIQADAVISVSEEAPAQEPIQADAVISVSEEAPAQEPIQADAVISASEEVPAQEPIQADAVISVSEEAPAQEPIQADAVISASEEVPAQEPIQADAVISASEEVPAQEPIQADAVISASEEVPAQEPIQADAVISVSEEAPAQEPIQADAVISVSEEAPAQEPIQTDAAISASEEAPAQEPIQTDAAISASEEAPAQEPIQAVAVLENVTATTLSAEIIPELQDNIPDSSPESSPEFSMDNLSNAGTAAVLSQDATVAPLIERGAVENPAPAQPQEEIEEARKILRGLITKHNVQAISIGTGTGARELETALRQIVTEEELIPIAAVNDAGIAIYSSSRIAREEFPDWNVSARCAVSLARRLQDPLAELIKIDPKLIGVGQYQHDVDQKELHRGLLHTVQYCVNKVGVNVNSAGESLLRYVSGLNEKLARRIVAYRNTHGLFRSRTSLMAAVGIDPSTFEQAAGFLRIPEGENPLDRTAVHPESYPIAEKMAASLGVGINELIGNKELLSSLKLESFVDGAIGPHTLYDIREELVKAGRDPRKAFKVPKFRADVKEMSDLQTGMILEGTVTNVTNFGAFVDIGVRQDGLIHLSQMSNRFIRDPREAVKVGDVVQVKVISVEAETKRIGLSMKALLPAIQKRRRKPQRRSPKPPAPHRQPEEGRTEVKTTAATGVSSTPTETVPEAPPRENRQENRFRPKKRGPFKREQPEKTQQQKEAAPKLPEPSLQEKIAILQSKFRGIN